MSMYLKYLRCLIASFLFFIFASSDTWATSNFAYSDEWLAIGHYQSKWNGYESTIDTDNFFLSENGKVNPKSELDATIALFQSDNDKIKCLFPARYILLRKFNLVKIKFPKCEEYDKFYDDLRPAGVTFLFTDAYMNSPSSLFGHTLIRIDTKRTGSQLLAHGANYGAFTGENPGPLYPILGIFGGYYGGFTVKPYYDIINTYNNIENRDIWELELNLSQKEIDFFVAHLWEVGQAQSRYYFFERNCSYMLMELLDVVQPTLKMAKKFPLQTIPIDTFKAVYKAKGLVKNVNYRPSRQNKIRYNYNQMNQNQKNAFLEIIANQKYKSDTLSDAEKAEVLETAYQYVQYKNVAQEISLTDYRKQSFKLLQNRNKIKNIVLKDNLIEGKPPFDTHNSMRAETVLGEHNGDGFEEISIRPAYHSLTDDNYGFLRGAEINFLDTTVRHYNKKNNMVLEKFELLSIRSISPADKMFNPISFQIFADVSRETNKDKKDGYVANLVVGGGSAYTLKNDVWIFALINNHLAYGGFLPRNQWAGISGNIGLLADWGRLRWLAEAEKTFATSKIGSKIIYKSEILYSVSRNLALLLNYKYQQNYGEDIEEWGVGLRSYF